ncbi:hypothetical protein MG293_014982 [Ovis ammon polii]|uniref:Uncharacterized protein n=1 Tax=Ovis ammon polii TaxID=230172 RepID=A0AAD4TTS1_OVIAM|nr:hypothetical protein MG293_014982 [Ovis ammon polii]
MQAWRLAALPGLLCPSAGQPAFLFIGAAGGLQAAYRKRCLEKQEAFEAQGRVASEMSIGETSGRSLKGDSRLRADPLSSGSWAPGPAGPKDRQHLDGTAAGPLLPTRRRAAPRGPDAEQRSTDTRSVSPGLVPDGCKQHPWGSYQTLPPALPFSYPWYPRALPSRKKQVTVPSMGICLTLQNPESGAKTKDKCR